MHTTLARSARIRCRRVNHILVALQLYHTLTLLLYYSTVPSFGGAALQRLDHVTREGALGLLGARSPASLDLFAVCVVELNDGVVSAVSVLMHLGVQLGSGGRSLVPPSGPRLGTRPASYIVW